MNKPIPHWLVSDPAFNQEEAWPAKEFPEATLHYMREAGCLVTALASMLRIYGLEQETDPEKFNPWVLCQRLKQARAFTGAANLQLPEIEKLYPVRYLGRTEYSLQKLAGYLEADEMCLIQVKGVHDLHHYVLVLRVCQEDVKILDSGWDKPLLSCFSEVYRIIRFRKLE